MFAVAPIARSGALSAVQAKLGLDHLMGVPLKNKYKMIDYHSLGKYWDDVRIESEFEYYWQAVLVSGVKLTALHVSQPVLFYLPFVGYSPDMGWGQYICACTVVLHESIYLYVIGLALFCNPKFLLYGPNSSDKKDGELSESETGYFAAPACFIYNMCRQSIEDTYPRFMLAFGLIEWIDFVSFGVSVCAWMALIIGLFGHGVMFPSLFIGYMFCAMESVVAAIAFSKGRWRAFWLVVAYYQPEYPPVNQR